MSNISLDYGCDSTWAFDSGVKLLKYASLVEIILSPFVGSLKILL
jgi:hypothetical protein